LQSGHDKADRRGEADSLHLGGRRSGPDDPADSMVTL